MDFNQVRYFLALSDTLNFTRAAERCFVSQPALTQGIKRLEEELGGELVRRDGRFTELTDLGRGVRTHFEQINRTRHLVRMTAKAIVSGDVAELNIGVMCTIGPRVLTRMLNDFQMNHPMISIVLHDVTPPAIADLLLTGGLDAVFCARHGPAHPRLRYVNLFEEPMVVAFSSDHEFLSLESVPMAELVKQPYVERLHCEFRQETHNFSNDCELELNVVFRSEREDWIQTLVHDGVGVSVIPLFSLLEPELDHRPIVEPAMSRTVELAMVSETELSPALEKLIEQTTTYSWPAAESNQE